MPEMDGYYVEPGTTLFLFEGVPIDNSYEHSIWWAKGDTTKGRSDQFNFFISTYKHYDFEKQYYQRYEKGTLRVNMLSDDIMCCNYMIFANEPFSDRYYYAFITQIEYSANNVATIYYDLDYIQTFYFDFKLLPCFIDREHDAFDEMYGNVVNEEVDLGTNYLQAGDAQIFDMNDQGWALICSCDREGKTGTGNINEITIADNIAVCANIFAEDFASIDTDDDGTVKEAEDTKEFHWFMNGYFACDYLYYASDIAYTLDKIVQTGKTENIIALYQYPTTFGVPTESEIESGDTKRTNTLGFSKTRAIYRHDTGYTSGTGASGVPESGLDGYIPKNKKLYTYPYTFLLMSNNLGDIKKFYWEDFDQPAGDYTSVRFTFTLTLYPAAVVLGYPNDHRGIENDYDEGLVYDKFPMVPYSYDAFTAWWGNNRNQTTISLGTSILSAGTRWLVGEMQENAYDMIKGAGERNLVSGLSNTAVQAANLVGKMSDMKDSRPTSNFQSEEQVNLIAGKCQYNFYCMTIRHQAAEIIDQYFSRYGYATHKVKVPNTHARLNWTYVKTVGCALTGVLPTDARKAIEGIFNNGITFWTQGEFVGDYTLDNDPIGIEGEGDDI